MKLGFCFFALVFSVSLTAMAEEGGNFDSHKAEMLSNIDERISKLQEHKSCVSSAADKEALKACRGKMKEWRESEKTEMMGRRKERLDTRMKKLEEKKKKMESNE